MPAKPVPAPAGIDASALRNRMASARGRAGATAFETMRRADGAVGGASPWHVVTGRDIPEDRS